MREVKAITQEHERTPYTDCWLAHLHNRIHELEDQLRLERARNRALRRAVSQLMALTRDQP